MEEVECVHVGLKKVVNDTAGVPPCSNVGQARHWKVEVHNNSYI